MNMIESVLNFFINNAYADAATPASQPPSSGFPLVVMLAVFILFMYFAVWRPQSKRNKEQRNLLNSLAKGDEVMTAGGMLGRIAKISDNYIVLTIAENTDITMQKSSVVNALPKGTLKSIQ
jgi:preprotein translocase subunit YajC